MLHLLEHTFEHTITDVIHLLPFLFLTYLLMEMMEHYAGDRFTSSLQKAGKFGPVWGAVLGMLPQCGFSAAASSFYAGRVIGIGTLIAVFLSTSDEMLPILLSEAVPMGTIAKILGTKVLIACVSGFFAELVYKVFFHKQKDEMDIHTVCEIEHCNCEDGVFLSALKHTIKIFFYIFVITFVVNAIIHEAGHDSLQMLFSNIPVVGQMLSALVGLIPNCASSVVITQLYLSGVISAGMMMAGLLVNAGIGVLVLFRLNRNFKQNVGIVAAMYGFGVVWGLVIDLFGIAF